VFLTFLLFCVAVPLLAADAPTVKVELKDLPIIPGSVAKAIKVTVTDSAQKGVKDVPISAKVDKGDATLSAATATTDTDGVATFDLTTKKDLFAVVVVSANTDAVKFEEKRTLIPSPDKLSYKAEARSAPLTVHANARDAVKVTVTATRDDAPVPVAKARVRASVAQGDADLSFDGKTGAKDIVGETGDDGVVKFDVLTNEDPTIKIRFVPLDKDGEADADQVELLDVGGSAFATSLGSRRSYLQLFLGQTFSNAYDSADPDKTNEHKGIGFKNSGPIIRLTLDTMWPHQCEKKCDRDADLKSMWHGLAHTDANLEFSRFPFGKDATTIEQENATNGVENAFSGSLGLTWQPNRFASFDDRDPHDLSPQDPDPYDAYRFGLFAKMGVTSRAKSEPSGNNSINRIQFGLRFTHSRSKSSNAIDERWNEVPIRFVELSVARFSDWGDFPNHSDGAPRLVLDAGLRITALSNEIFPVYVGGHLNTGPGPDDLRVFIGMLVRLDFLGRIAQGLVKSPNDLVP
jgi:hypothetical protein